MPRRKGELPLTFGKSNDRSSNGPDASANRDASGTGDSSGDSIDATSGIRHDSNIGESGGTGDVTRDDDFDLPIDTGDDARRYASDPTRKARKRRSDAGSSRSNPRANQEYSTTETGASSADGTIPREVKFSELGKSSTKPSAKASALTTEFFTEGWALIFQGASLFTKDEEWKLPVGDAQELAERTQKWIGSLDQRSLAAIEKRIAKIQPALSLTMALVAVIGPRVVHTRSLKKNVKHSPAQSTARPNPGPANSNGPVNSAPVTETVIPMGEKVNGPETQQPIPKTESRFVGHSIKSQDWTEFFGGDNA